MLVNWNNRPAPGWGAADDNWSYGSVQRVRMLDAGIAKRGQHDLASVTVAMNAAATQDLRSVALTPVLDEAARGRRRRRRARATRMLDLLDGLARGGLLAAWTATSTARWTPAPRPAIWDALLPEAVRRPRCRSKGALGARRRERPAPRSGFTGGGFWYLDKDLRTLVGDEVQRPVQRAVLRRRRPREVRRGGLEGARRRARRPGRA